MNSSFWMELYFEWCEVLLLSEVTNECITNGGKRKGVTCKFPFYYDAWDDIPYAPVSILRWFSHKIRFDSCTDFRNSGRKWCATKVTSENRYVDGEWGECPDSDACNIDEGEKT